jgi:regulator of cell morphogenesis and NO signaling
MDFALSHGDISKKGCCNMDTTVTLERSTDADWRDAPTAELVDYLVARFHERHRVQFPELIRLARKIEHVHAGRPHCPVGLADVLEGLQQELESHMMKEEQVLFPMLIDGMGHRAGGPITVMLFEHDQHHTALEAIDHITRNLTLPVDACNTWHALYGHLDAFRRDLTRHIELENNVLFAKVTNEAEGAHHG